MTPEFIVADRVLVVEEKRHLLHEATGHGANLAPGCVHYNFSEGPDMARVIAAYLETHFGRHAAVAVTLPPSRLQRRTQFIGERKWQTIN